MWKGHIKKCIYNVNLCEDGMMTVDLSQNAIATFYPASNLSLDIPEGVDRGTIMGEGKHSRRLKRRWRRRYWKAGQLWVRGNYWTVWMIKNSKSVGQVKLRLKLVVITFENFNLSVLKHVESNLSPSQTVLEAVATTEVNNFVKTLLQIQSRKRKEIIIYGEWSWLSAKYGQR